MPDLWHRATHHPFLAAVRDGSLSPAAFDAWLVQDYRFVANLLRFQARLLARAPRRAQSVLAAGLVALVDELGWFEQLASGRGLDLDAPPEPAPVAYAALLQRLDGEPFDVAIRALWAIERAYHDAWAFAAPGAPPYREVVAHWTTPQFADYVAALADVAGETSGRVVDEVLEHEIAFWEMAWGR